MPEVTPDAPARLHALVSGRVQGVFFRQSTADRARALAVDGWVRNLPDGRVELAAEGPREALEALLTFVRRGPEHARVASVEASWEAPVGEGPGFEVRRGP